ncbi:MAG: hypothetical protein CVU48_05900 [Candidatus Cloacimonetes bacterium HGW-Cloacimonetes-1]|jgi:hypothetical protein|nr:MAG: hypothetical protein CVU48_05900 [Candidatus Cloacimonetes bacterium HGW-Cloacimonetes-1]
MITRCKYLLVLLVLVFGLLSCSNDDNNDNTDSVVETMGQYYDLLLYSDWWFELSVRDSMQTSTDMYAYFYAHCSLNNPNLNNPQDVYTLTINSREYPLTIDNDFKSFYLRLLGTDYAVIPICTSMDIKVQKNAAILFSGVISIPSQPTNLLVSANPDFTRPLSFSWSLNNDSQMQMVQAYGESSWDYDSWADAIAPSKRSVIIPEYSICIDDSLEDWGFAVVEGNYKEYQNNLFCISKGLVKMKYAKATHQESASILSVMKNRK